MLLLTLADLAKTTTFLPHDSLKDGAEAAAMLGAQVGLPILGLARLACGPRAIGGRT
jgi:hypothetical protein